MAGKLKFHVVINEPDSERDTILRNIANQQNMRLGDVLWQAFVEKYSDEIKQLRSSPFFADNHAQKTETKDMVLKSTSNGKK